MKYKVYNKLHYNGKPRGTAYVAGIYEARSLEDARKKAERHNRQWNNIPVNKREKVSARAVKVMQLTSRGTLKGKKRRRKSPDLFRPTFSFRI